MAKKDKKKKSKKAKKERGSKRSGKRSARREAVSNIPYPDSDGTRDFLTKVLIVLCCITVGLMIYTIHYMKFVSEEAKSKAERAAAETAASAPAVGSIWFSQPDGTFISESGAAAAPSLPSSSVPSLPSAQREAPATESAGEPVPAEGEAPPDGNAPDAGAEEPAAPIPQ